MSRMKKRIAIVLWTLMLFVFINNCTLLCEKAAAKPKEIINSAIFSPAENHIHSNEMANISNEAQVKLSKSKDEKYFIVKVKLINEEVKFLLSRLNLDIIGVHKNIAYILAGAEELELMSAYGLQYLLVRQVQPRKPEEGLIFSSSANGAFHSYLEVEEGLQSLTQQFSPIAALHNLGQTIEGRNIWGVKISDNVELDEDEPEVLFVGCHHAREWISVEVPYMLAEHFVRNYRENPHIRRLVNQSEIWIVPLLNPDGLEYSIQTFRWWRKNRRNNADGTFGVDPNRNYGYMWGFDNMGSSPNTYSQTYRGPYAFSELETEAMRQLFQQREFLAAISYHNYSNLILYPWSYANVIAPHFSLFSFLSIRMSELIEAVRGSYYLPGPGPMLYVTNGEFNDWAYGEYGTLAFTIELPPDEFLLGGFVNAEAEIIPIFQENLPAALFLIQWCIDNY